MIFSFVVNFKQIFQSLISVSYTTFTIFFVFVIEMTTTQLEKIPRVKIPISQLNKAFQVFKITDQEMSIAINYWLTTESHPLPRRKLTGLSSQLGFRF